MGPNNTKNSPLNVNFSYLTMDNIAIILFYCKKKHQIWSKQPVSVLYVMTKSGAHQQLTF
jgi:hypothetical protein